MGHEELMRGFEVYARNDPRTVEIDTIGPFLLEKQNGYCTNRENPHARSTKGECNAAGDCTWIRGCRLNRQEEGWLKKYLRTMSNGYVEGQRRSVELPCTAVLFPRLRRT